jgi:hypothetical protein
MTNLLRARLRLPQPLAYDIDQCEELGTLNLRAQKVEMGMVVIDEMGSTFINTVIGVLYRCHCSHLVTRSSPMQTEMRTVVIDEMGSTSILSSESAIIAAIR